MIIRLCISLRGVSPVGLRMTRVSSSYDDTDLYELYADGSKAVKMTSGAADQVRYRKVNVSSVGGGRGEEAIDFSKPVYLSMYGIWTKKTGYAILNGGNVEKPVWIDKGVSRLIKAKDADTYGYVAEAFDSSPNYFAAQGDLKNARQVSDTNPFQTNYAWGKAHISHLKANGYRGRCSIPPIMNPASSIHYWFISMSVRATICIAIFRCLSGRLIAKLSGPQRVTLC